MLFSYDDKKKRSFHQKQVINEALMEKMHDTIREMRATEMTFHDLSEVEFPLVDQYTPIPEEYGKGVQMKLSEAQMMGAAKRIEVIYEPGGEMFPHFCKNCHEIIRVKSGAITDKMINETYSAGTVFLLKKGVKHHLFSPSGAELITYLVYSNHYLSYLQELKKII